MSIKWIDVFEHCKDMSDDQLDSSVLVIVEGELENPSVMRANDLDLLERIDDELSDVLGGETPVLTVDGNDCSI
tara:strand:- start:52 stop:273 length:222 start_codon:yes stop_codon:yes gene_type:complete